jgi:hypothetical protein
MPLGVGHVRQRDGSATITCVGSVKALLAEMLQGAAVGQAGAPAVRQQRSTLTSPEGPVSGSVWGPRLDDAGGSGLPER